MFDLVRKYQKVMLGIILLGIFPAFVFFGLEGYGRMGGGDEVAVVEGRKISQQAFDQAHRQQIERLQQMLGGQVDTRMFDTPAARRQTLEQLITQEAMLAEARRKYVSVPPAEVQKNILAIEGLTGADGKFDFERYRTLLAQQNMSPAMFEAQMAQDLALRQLASAVQSTAIVPRAVVDRLFELQESRRTVRTRLIEPKAFESGIEPTDEEIRRFYEENQAAFQVPESVDIEYVLLDRARLAAGVSPSEQELRAYYEQNKDRYADPEQRRASHILVEVPASADEAARAAAQALAEKLLAEVKAAPEKFADIARQHSDDPGSKEQGGDLGFFSRDMMVAPFSDAAFAMKEGEISDLVKSDFGFHIIKVTGAKGSGVRPFEEVKAEIEAQYREQAAARRYTELAESFTNTVYEQSDSLKPAVDKYSLELRRQEKLTRDPGPELPADSPLRNPRFIELIYGDEAMQHKRNTEAFEVAPGVMISARVTAHHPTSRQPLDAVRDEVKARLVAEQAGAKAREQGKALLAKLKEAPSESPPEGFGEPLTVSRADPGSLPPPAVAEAFRLPPAPLPAYVGVDLGSRGYQLVRLEKVEGPDPANEGRREEYAAQAAQLMAQTALSAYIEEVKARTDIERRLQ